MLVVLEVAVEFDRDWTTVGWVIAALIGVAAAVVAVVAPFVWAGLEVRGGRGVGWWRTVLLLLALVTAATLAVLPGTMMRHVEYHPNVWWVALPWAALALFFAWRGAFRLDDWLTKWAAGYVPAMLIAAGLIIGAVNDALHRLAAWIPTTVAAVVAILAVLILAAIAKSRD